MITFDAFTSLNFGYLRSHISQINLKPYAECIQNETYRNYFCGEVGEEHYKLLAFLSQQINNSQIYDIGTHIGGSSIALAHNKNNIVISYDVVNVRDIKNPPSNIIYHLGDFMKDPEVLSSPLIFIDADHNGIDELQFHNFFLRNKYRGIVLWDDIHLDQNMKDFWRTVENPKFDLTSLGHKTGTGLILYGSNQ